MTLPYPVNVTVDIYRTFDVTNPIQVGQPAVSKLQAHLRHHLKNGRFGFQTKELYWTNVLHLPLGTDIRSAYNSQLDPAYRPQNADTVVVRDWPNDGDVTAFMVVMVTRALRGTPNEHLKCYLDKAGKGGGVQCCGDPVSDTLHVSITAYGACSCLNGLVFTIRWDDNARQYIGTFSACGFSNTFKFWCSDGPDGAYGYSYSIQCGNGPIWESNLSGTEDTCHPFMVGFSPALGYAISQCCTTDNLLTITVTE
jgi:hypothetical protein